MAAARGRFGIGADDVVMKPDMVTVHSLGAKPAEGGTVELRDTKGKVVASSPVPTLAAPLDLLPKTAKVTLPRKVGAVSVRVLLSVPEITLFNNEIRIPSRR